MKKLYRINMLIAIATVIASCSSNDDSNNNDPYNPPQKPSIKYYTNPVLHPDTFGSTKINSMADPFVLKDIDGTYYMYVTGKGFSVFSSKNLVDWEYKGKVFPRIRYQMGQN